MTNAQMSRRLFTLLAVCAKKQDMLKEIALDKFRLSPAYETIQNIDDYLFLTDRAKKIGEALRNFLRNDPSLYVSEFRPCNGRPCCLRREKQ